MLNDFLTTKQPLGPFRHERILKSANGDPPSTLLYKVKTFDQITNRDSAIIVGRRGAGKTAIVSAFLARSENEDYFYSPGWGEGKKRNDICIFINSWDQLDAIVDKVIVDAQFHLRGDTDWSTLLPETVARMWDRRLWQVIIRHLYSRALADRTMHRDLHKVVAYVQNEDVPLSGVSFTDDALNERFKDVKNSVIDYLKKHERRCILVIDSLEQYPVLSPKFEKVTSGFLRCVNDFNDDGDPVHVVCCIPEEIEHIFLSRAANRLKDLSDAGVVSRLRWRPFDLLKIIAERYREFLKIYLADNDFIELIEPLNFSTRTDLSKFFSYVMPDQIVNRLGKPESAIAYIVRHTQLLPREFILIFNRAIVKSHEMKGSWRYLEDKAIVEAVEDQEPELADQILSPYEALYPRLINACRKVIPELPPVFSNSDADKWRSQLEHRSKYECEDPWDMAFRMGIIGYLDPNTPSAHSLYEYGNFHYNARSPITWGNDRYYCVHPIFSGTWKLRRREADIKFIYPARIEEILWDE